MTSRARVRTMPRRVLGGWRNGCRIGRLPALWKRRSAAHRVISGWIFVALLVTAACWEQTRLTAAAAGAVTLGTASFLGIRTNWRQDRAFLTLMLPMWVLVAVSAIAATVMADRPWEVAPLVVVFGGAAAVASRCMALAGELAIGALDADGRQRVFWHQWTPGPYWCLIPYCDTQVDGDHQMLCARHVTHPLWLRDGSPPHCAVMSCHEPSPPDQSLCQKHAESGHREPPEVHPRNPVDVVGRRRWTTVAAEIAFPPKVSYLPTQIRRR